jgi:adenylate cyclase
LSEGERRLAAIMFTDMVGYTSLTQRGESLAMELLEEQRGIVRPFLSRHAGREVKTIGDAFLVEFDSALEAVRCAYEIQQSLHDLNERRPLDRRITIRVGIHLGDVIHNQSDVYGDAVNVASRIEPLAPPAGICVTEQVYYQIRNKFEFPLLSLGRKELKNVGEPVEVFRMVLPWEKEESAPAALDKKRIAVLPFANLSSDPEEGYFADGMTEELITSISGVRQLTVIARTSIMKYKGSQKGAADVGKELSVGTLLEGSVRKAGNRVRITAQLIDTETEGHLWAQNYDRQLEDVFAIQSEIAEKVASELKIRLVGEEKKVIEKKATENTDAYMHYLRGKELEREMREPSVRNALAAYEKAIELDPGFAKAYAGVAVCLVKLVNDGVESYEQMAPKAEMAARRAIQLDPDLAEAHAMLADVCFLEDKIKESESEARRAVELNPSLPDAHLIISNLEFIHGRIQEGITEVDRSYKLDPARPELIDRFGWYLFNIGRVDEALAHWDKTLNLAPGPTYRNMTEYHISKGDIEKGKETFAKAESADPSNRWLHWMRGYIAAITGDKETAKAAIKSIEEDWLGATNLNDVAFVYYGLGDLDSYFAYVDRANDQHVLRFRYVMYSPLFEKSRHDPRYSDIIAKVNRMMGS